MRVRAFLYFLVGSILFSSSMVAERVSEEDWPCFLGPNGDNTSSAAGLLDAWLAGGPPLLWHREVGTGFGAPSILGSLLVLHHRQGNQEVLEAFDAASGTSRWRRETSTRFVDPYGYNNGPRSTPLLTSNRCYALGAEGRLLCVELQTGRLIWELETAKTWSVPEAFFGVGSTPLLEGGRLIVMVGGQPNAGVVALDPATGKTLWENVGKSTWQGERTLGWRAEIPYRWSGEEKLASYASPVATTIHGQRHLLCLMRQGLVSLDPQDGQVRFKRWFQAQVHESVNAMCPVVQKDVVMISAAYDRVGAVTLRVAPDGRSFEEVWRSPVDAFQRDHATGRFVPPVLELHWNTPVLHQGYLYAFSGRNESDATFRCVDFNTGRLMWSRDERWRPGGSRQPDVYGRGSAILADGKLLVLGEGGKLGLFRPNPTKPEELSSFQVPHLQYPCWTAPVLAGKRLYLRDEKRVVCYLLSRLPAQN